MALGTFTITIDANQLGASTERTASIQVKIANGNDFIKDNAAGEFWFPHLSSPKPLPVSLPYSLTLVTDVDSGESTEIGYTVTVTTKSGGRVAAGPFPAQAPAPWDRCRFRCGRRAGRARCSRSAGSRSGTYWARRHI